MPETIFDPAAGIVRCEHKKAAIIGTGRSRVIAPWDDPAWCFFSLNEIPQKISHRHFELHPMSVQSAHDLFALAALPFPCYILDLKETEKTRVEGFVVGRGPYFVNNAVQYPLKRVLAMPGARDWFTSTFSYQVALAVLDGFEEIGVWGVDLRRGTLRERTVEWGCLAWWLGYAAGRGVHITLPSNEISWSHPGRYGYDYEQEKLGVETQMRDIRTFVMLEERNG